MISKLRRQSDKLPIGLAITIILILILGINILPNGLPNFSYAVGLDLSPAATYLNNINSLSYAQFLKFNQDGLYNIDNYITNKPNIVFVHGGRSGKPQDYKNFIEKYKGKYNLFAFSYKDNTPLEKITKSFRRNLNTLKNKYKILNKVAIVANSYGTIVVRKAILEDKRNLFKDMVIIQLVPLLGGSSCAMGLTNFNLALRLGMIKFFGDGASWHLSNTVDPLSSIQKSLFSQKSCKEFLNKIKRTHIIRVAKDPNSPEVTDFIQKVITTKKDREKFKNLYANGLIQAKSITTYDLSSANPHDDILNFYPAIKEVEKIINLNA